MKKMSELTSDDFPGFDQGKVSEWLLALDSATKTYWVIVVVLLLTFILLSMVAGTLVLPGVLLLVIIQLFVFHKANKLRKELGITGKTIKLARKGELVNSH